MVETREVARVQRRAGNPEESRKSGGRLRKRDERGTERHGNETEGSPGKKLGKAWERRADGGRDSAAPLFPHRTPTVPVPLSRCLCRAAPPTPAVPLLPYRAPLSTRRSAPSRLFPIYPFSMPGALRAGHSPHRPSLGSDATRPVRIPPCPRRKSGGILFSRRPARAEKKGGIPGSRKQRTGGEGETGRRQKYRSLRKAQKTRDKRESENPGKRENKRQAEREPKAPKAPKNKKNKKTKPQKPTREMKIRKTKKPGKRSVLLPGFDCGSYRFRAPDPNPRPSPRCKSGRAEACRTVSPW